MLTPSALIQGHFDYASAIWYSGLTQTLKNKLQIVQNKVIRCILDLPARSHVGYDEFSKANMFPGDKRVEQLKMNHLFNIIHGTAPVFNFNCDGFNYLNFNPYHCYFLTAQLNYINNMLCKNCNNFILPN